MNIKLFTAILAIFFITGCGSIPEDSFSGGPSDSVEREDEILRQRITEKKSLRKDAKGGEETTLNNNVIEEDPILNTRLKDKQKIKLIKIRNENDIDDAELDDEIDHDAIDIDYRKKKDESSTNSDN